MTDPTVKIGRLALRQEGDNWNAYYMLPDSNEAPLVLGSIRMAAVVGHDDRKLIFMNLMRDFVGDIIEEATGIRPTWGGPERAPEHERAGSA